MSTAPSPDPQQGRADLRTYMGLFWRRKWLLLLVVVAIPLAVYGVSARAPDKYESSALLQMQPQTVDSSLFTTENSQTADTSQTAEQLTASARLIKTREVARRATRRIDPQPANLSALLKQVSAVPDTSSGLITITARDADPATNVGRSPTHSPERFALSANARPWTGSTRRPRSSQASLEGLAPSDAVGRRQLSEQLQRLRALRAAQGNNVQIVEPARPSSAPVSPRPLRNAALALLIALLLAAGLGVPAGANGPPCARPTRARAAQPRAAAECHPEVRVLHSDLGPERCRGVPDPAGRPDLLQRQPSAPVVVVTSPGKGDGKTTVSTQLAIAVASSGKHVVLVEGDMRHPNVAALLGQTAEAGLGRCWSVSGTSTM